MQRKQSVEFVSKSKPLSPPLSSSILSPPFLSFPLLRIFTEMKDDSSHHHHPRKLLPLLFTQKKFTKATVYILLLALSYAFGFFSASTVATTRPNSDITTTRRPEKPVSFIPDHDLFRFNTRCAEPVPSKLVRQTILDRIYNGTSPFDDFPPPHAAALLRQKRIKGWGSTGAVFENLIRKVQPRTIVEIGSFLGASAIHMAELTRKLGLKTLILCIDDFRGWPEFRKRFRDIKMVNGEVMLMYQFMQNVAYVNETETVLHVPHSTASALVMLCEWGVYADLIEVDAGHDFHSAWADINRAYAILRPGGVMFGHDYFTAADNRGVRRAVTLFAKVKGLKVETDGEHWVIASD